MQRFGTSSVIRHETTTDTSTGCRGVRHSSRRSSSKHGTGITSTGNVSWLIPEINHAVVARGAGEQAPVGSGPQIRSAHFVGAKQLPPCWCPFRCVFVGEWYPLGGGISLEFDALFRRTSVWFVVFRVPPVIN